MDALKRLSEWALRYRYPAVPILLGVALASPSLFIGLQADDLFIRGTVLGEQPIEGLFENPWAPYAYMDGDPAHNHILMDRGWMPWWTDPECRAALSRPLTALTQMLDHNVWPDFPLLMHLQSLVWFGLLIWAAAILYKKMMAFHGGSAFLWMAALAAILFAVDDARALPAGWLANRNAVIAGFFGCVTIIAHDRWRRDGWRAGAWLAPATLLLALLGKEEAVATGAYLFSYAVCLERGPWRRRLGALLPCLAVGLVWFVAYISLGYGVSGSGVYVDPAHDPARFARQAARNGPILLLGQWGFPTSDISLHWSISAFRIHWLWAVGFLALLTMFFAPLLRRDRLARFWALGMVLSVVPVCAIFVSDRLLTFIGLGAMPLMAQWLGGAREGLAWAPRSMSFQRAARVLGYLFIVLHLIVAPLLLPVMATAMHFVGGALDRHYDTLPTDPEFETQTAVFVNSLVVVSDMVWIQSRLYRGQPLPARSLNLSPSYCAATMTRTDPNTLVVRPRGGYLRPRGWAPVGNPPAPAFSLAYHAHHMDTLVRGDDHPMSLGYTVELSEVTIRITGLTEDGRPAEVTFRFRVPLEHPSLRWLELTVNGYKPFTVPAVGATVAVVSPLGGD